jgi:hypothetical protein
MISADDSAALGFGLAFGAGAAVTSEPLGLGVALSGIGFLFYAISRRYRDAYDLATDGGTARREAPEEAAPEQPTVLDVRVEGDRMLASAERGDISLVVEAPAGTSEEEISKTLSGVPESIERTSKRFAETTTMSANTTEDDGSSAVEDTADEDFGGGA